MSIKAESFFEEQFEGKPVTFFQVKGETEDRWACLAKDLGNALEYSGDGSRLTDLVTEWGLDEGEHFEVVRYGKLKQLIELLGATPYYGGALRNVTQLMILYEEGINMVLMSSNKEKAKLFKKWWARVLVGIRKREIVLPEKYQPAAALNSTTLTPPPAALPAPSSDVSQIQLIKAQGELENTKLQRDTIKMKREQQANQHQMALLKLVIEQLNDARDLEPRYREELKSGLLNKAIEATPEEPVGLSAALRALPTPTIRPDERWLTSSEIATKLRQQKWGVHGFTESQLLAYVGKATNAGETGTWKGMDLETRYPEKIGTKEGIRANQKDGVVVKVDMNTFHPDLQKMITDWVSEHIVKIKSWNPQRPCRVENCPYGHREGIITRKAQ